MAWSRYDTGLRDNRLVRRVMKYLGHKKSLRALVRVEGDGLGLNGTRAKQRKDFGRFVNTHKADRGWVLYQAQTKAMIGKDYFGDEKKVPIINTLTKKHLTKRYGPARRKWPDQCHFMHVWQYAAVIMCLKSGMAERLAQFALSAASLLTTLGKLDKPSRYLRKAQRVSLPSLSAIFFCLLLYLFV